MDQRCHTFSFGHYHQVPGASCGILSQSYLLSFLRNPYNYIYIPFLIYEIFHLLEIINTVVIHKPHAHYAIYNEGCTCVQYIVLIKMCEFSVSSSIAEPPVPEKLLKIHENYCPHNVQEI